MQDKPISKRGMLSELSSVYDPLGFVAPFLLHGRKIIQILSQQELGWDEIVSDEVVKDWVKWKSKLPALENLRISRCIKSVGFGKIMRSSIHHFSDASEGGYGQSSYLRLEDDQGKIHCVLLIGKSKASPLKYISIPRLELIAATLSVKGSLLLRQKLGIPINKEYFWTDSKVVLGYINNNSKKFKIFVANWIQFIRENADPKQWFYVPTKENPADGSSRGLKDVHSEKTKRWFEGPGFLWKPDSKWPAQVSVDVDGSDPEVKATLIINLATTEYDLLSKLEAKFSSWLKLRKAVAIILQLKQILLMQVRLKQCATTKGSVNMEMLQEASNAIIKLVQNTHFKDEVKKIRQKEGSLGKESQISTLNPFMDKHGIIRVGGRIRRSGLRDKCKYPILLPKKSKVTDLIVQWCHYNTAHSGRGMTLNEIRCRDFVVICGSSVVKSAIFKCVTCCKLRGRIGQQMADLPKDRFEVAPLFIYCAVDMFGPFTVRVKRSNIKCYGQCSLAMLEGLSILTLHMS